MEAPPRTRRDRGSLFAGSAQLALQQSEDELAGTGLHLKTLAEILRELRRETDPKDDVVPPA